MIRIGVIGYGYWGPNLVRNFAECPATPVRAVCDLRPERLRQVGAPLSRRPSRRPTRRS